MGAVTVVSKILGHTNLMTTSRYLNIHRRRLQAAMETLEEHHPRRRTTSKKTHRQVCPRQTHLRPWNPLAYSNLKLNRRIGLLLRTMAKVLEKRGRIIENVNGAYKVGV